MKKAVRLLSFVVSSLLLTACEIPTSLEEFLGWREKFFLEVPEEQITLYLGPLLILLALAGFLGALWALATQGMGSGYLTSMLLLFAIPLTFYFFIPVTSKIGELLIPPELTVDAVLAAMRWELSTNLAKIVTAVWGVTLTILLPLIHSRWQIIMLVMAIFALAWSIVGRSIKGLAFIAGMILGWAMFLVLFNAMVQFFGANYPEGWDVFPPVMILINAFYSGVLVIMMVMCYIMVPIIAAILSPDLKESGSFEKAKMVSQNHQRSHRDWSGVFAVPIPERRNPSPPSSNGDFHNNQKDEGDLGYEDAVYRDVDVPVPELGPGNSRLTSGKAEESDYGDEGGSPSSNPPKHDPKNPKIPPTPEFEGEDNKFDISSSQSHGQSSEDRSRQADQQDVVEGKYREVPPIPEMEKNQLKIACENCGGQNPYTYTNCQFCKQVLDTEKAAAVKNDELAKADNKKRKIGFAAMAVDAVSVIAAPEAAKVIIPVVNKGAAWAQASVDKKTAESLGKEAPSVSKLVAEEIKKSASKQAQKNPNPHIP